MSKEERTVIAQQAAQDGAEAPEQERKVTPSPTRPAVKPATYEKRVPWGPWTAVLYAVAVFLAAQFVASLIVIIYPHVHGWDKATAQSWLNNSVIAQFWYVLIAEAMTFGAIWWFVRRRKAGLRVIGWRGVRFWDPIVALAGFAAYFVGYAVLLAIATHLFPSLNINQKQQLGFQNTTGDLNLFLAFLSLVVLPPVVEETVFRGFVFTGLRNKFRWVWAALLTSLLFASAHLEFGSGQPLLWVAAIDTFTLSMVLCYLREETDSLWPGIFLHALKNGIAFLSLFILHLK